MISKAFIGFPRWCSGKESACQGRRCRRCMMMPSPHAPNSHPPRTPHPTRDFCIHYWAGSISTSFHSPEKLRQESDTFPSWLPYFLSHTTAAAKSLQSCPTLCDPPGTVACQAPLFMGFSRQEYWSGLPCPPSGDRLVPGIEPASLTSPALAGRSFTARATWEAHIIHTTYGNL